MMVVAQIQISMVIGVDGGVIRFDSSAMGFNYKDTTDTGQGMGFGESHRA